MKVAVFGGSGFIGGHLAHELADRGDEVVIVSRKPREERGGIRYSTWHELIERPELLEGFDAFVNLAGESINQRWTSGAKRRILESRLDATGRVAAIVERLKEKPEVVINGSGMSIYGYSDEQTYDEDSPKRLTDFLATTVDGWERAADRIRGVRLVKLRIGLVLGPGGAFPLMMLPYRMFVGGRVGSGKQWHSWIHIEDMTGIIRFCMENRQIGGPVNCTAPEPVTNDTFGRRLSAALGRPHWFPVPEFLFRLALGEMSEVLLKGQRVLPAKITEAGYVFRYPTIDAAFRQLIGTGS